MKAVIFVITFTALVAVIFRITEARGLDLDDGRWTVLDTVGCILVVLMVFMLLMAESIVF